MKLPGSRNPEYLLLAAVFVLLLVLSFLSQGYYGGTDNINHYFLSRYSWTYPRLLLDAWGRPLYTVLASPFAQFGFQGIKVFNVILGTLSALCLLKTARVLKLSQPWMVVIILLFSPLYMVMLFTAMTEILFSFVLALSLCLFFSKRYIASAIAISFLPFARSEGYFIIPMIFLGLLMRRQWKAIPFLGTGFLVLSLAGAYQYGDLLWVIRNNPYPLIHPVYHTPGPFWTFIRQTDVTFGLPNLVLICLGIIVLMVRLFNVSPPGPALPGTREKGSGMIHRPAVWPFTRMQERQTETLEVILLFLGPLLAYYFFHSYMYSKGWAGSLGFIRVMAAVIPAASMIALYGAQLIQQLAGNRKWLRTTLFSLLTVLIIFFNFRTFRFPLPLGREEAVIKASSKWVRSAFSTMPLVFYNDFNVPYYLGTDPYSLKQSIQLWHAPAVKDLPMGSLYIWDAHFGPNECEVPLDSVMQDPYMHLIRLFRPRGELITFGNRPYEVYIFRKGPAETGSDNYLLAKKYLASEDSLYVPVMHRVFDFEKLPEEQSANRQTENPGSGRQSFRMGGDMVYSPGLDLKCSEIPVPGSFYRVKACVKVLSPVPFDQNTSYLVISLEGKKGSYAYKALDLSKCGFMKGIWNEASFSADLPDIRSGDDVLKVYIWHQGDEELSIDDLTIDILAAAKEKE